MKSAIISANGEPTLTDQEIIEVIEFRVGNVRVVPGGAFSADDWLRDLGVKVRAGEIPCWMSSLLCVERVIRLATLQNSVGEMNEFSHHRPDNLHLALAPLA